MLQPLNRRTWAITGTRPKQIVSQRRDRLSVIGNLSISPRRWLVQPAFRIHDHNIRTAHVVDYLRALHRQHRRPLIVVLDRLNVHRAAVKQLHAAGVNWLRAEWLPPYAPDLNPVEGLWSHAKYSALANFVPDGVTHLYDAVIEAVGDTHFNQPLLKSFFQTAQLKL